LEEIQMRKTLGFLALVAVTAVAFAQTNGSSLVANFVKSLNDAKSVSSNYSVQTIGSASENYSLTLKKPNLARLETPTQIVVADGKEITTYDKVAKTYFKRPQTEADLKSLFASDETNLFSPFFDAAAIKPATAKALGTRTLKGATLNAVETTATGGKKVVTYFLDTSDSVARKSQIDLNDPRGKVTTIIDTKSLLLNSEPKADAFTFSAPGDAREVTLEEMQSTKWFTNLEEAMKVAASSNRRIFVDFMADWCGPCKMLERECFNTEEFKQLGKKYVFCKIDVDVQKGLAQQFEASSIPMQLVLDKNGQIIDKLVGYGGKHMFFAFLNRNAK